MADVLTRDADALHRALDTAGDEVKVSVSRETAEWLVRIVDARSRGQRIVVTHGHAEVTPAEAAALLGRVDQLVWGCGGRVLSRDASRDL